MDQYEIMSLLMRLETNKVDPYTVSMMYAETLAAIADRLTKDEMRSLLIIGAYIGNQSSTAERSQCDLQSSYVPLGSKRSSSH
jgi:hypothetical protein